MSAGDPRCFFFFLSAIIHRRQYTATSIPLPAAATTLQPTARRVTHLKPSSSDRTKSAEVILYFYSRVWRAQLTAPAVPRGNHVPRNEVNEITDHVRVCVCAGQKRWSKIVCVCVCVCAPQGFPEFVSDAWYPGVYHGPGRTSRFYIIYDIIAYTHIIYIIIVLWPPTPFNYCFSIICQR